MPTGLKFLIVDDDEAIRKTLDDVLVKAGHKVVTVGSGEEALARVRKEFFNVALIDIRLPDIKGGEVIKRIKEINSQINCIVITGYPEEKPEELIANGASRYFLKPIDLDNLINIIRKMTNNG